MGGYIGKKVRSVTSMPGEADTNHQSHLTFNYHKLTKGCQAFGKSITLPPFYQAEDKFESRDSFLAFSNVSSGRWTDLWKPLVTSPLNVTLRRLPKLLQSIEKIDLHDLVDQLETVDEEILPTGSWATSSMVLSSVRGYILVRIFLIVIQAIWERQWLGKCRKKGVPAGGLDSKKRSLVKTTDLQGTEDIGKDPEKGSQVEERLRLTLIHLNT